MPAWLRGQCRAGHRGALSSGRGAGPGRAQRPPRALLGVTSRGCRRPGPGLQVSVLEQKWLPFSGVASPWPDSPGLAHAQEGSQRSAGAVRGAWATTLLRDRAPARDGRAPKAHWCRSPTPAVPPSRPGRTSGRPNGASPAACPRGPPLLTLSPLALTCQTAIPLEPRFPGTGSGRSFGLSPARRCVFRRAGFARARRGRGQQLGH